MPNEKKLLSEIAANEILQMITEDGSFKPGDRLPSETELSQRLNISRGTLREAVKILVAQNALEIQRGKGTFIKHISSLGYQSELKSIAEARLELRDLMEMRLINEPEAAYLATIRATEKEINKILYYGRQVEEQILKGLDRTKADIDFHKSISKATHNEFMKSLIPLINNSINKAIKMSKQEIKITESTLVDHKNIMEFIEKRDPDGARASMKLHILHAMTYLDLESVNKSIKSV